MPPGAAQRRRCDAHFAAALWNVSPSPPVHADVLARKVQSVNMVLTFLFFLAYGKFTFSKESFFYFAPIFLIPENEHNLRMLRKIRGLT